MHLLISSNTYGNSEEYLLYIHIIKTPNSQISAQGRMIKTNFIFICVKRKYVYAIKVHTFYEFKRSIPFALVGPKQI